MAGLDQKSPDKASERWGAQDDEWLLGPPLRYDATRRGGIMETRGGVIPPEVHEAVREILDLSPREFQVALLLAEGLKYKAVASELNLSIHTVHEYVRRLYRKLEITDKAMIATSLFSAYRQLNDQ